MVNGLLTDQKRRQFDRNMEVLASIPVSPAYVTIADLSDDFLCPRGATSVIRDLRETYEIGGENKAGVGRIVWLMCSTAHKAIADAERYWTSFYGATKPLELIG